MGKAKQRSLRNGKYDSYPSITREEALTSVIENIEDKNKVLDTITLFGFTAEEMLEAGAAYEDVLAFGGIVN